MMNARQGQAVDEPEEDSTKWSDVVTVFWDIKGFPVPYGLDVRKVCLDIITYLEVKKYSAPFTIVVIGLLTHVPTDVLRALWSCGIILKNVPFDFTDIMDKWINDNPPPANMLVLSPSETSDKFLAYRKEQGYNIMVPFRYIDWFEFCDHVYSVRIREEDFCSETDDTGSDTDDTGSDTDETGSKTDDTDDSWFCSVSHEMSGKSFEDLITHLSQEHKSTEIVGAVTVFWDINAFPVPFCCEARKVCHYINRYLENSYYGPFTINAIGLLTRVPADVLRVLSSFGIILNHVPFDFTNIINQWVSVNPPPAETLVLCPYSKTFEKIIASRKEQGYNITVIEYNYSFWELVFLDLECSSTHFNEARKSSVTGDHASWYSSESNDITGKGLENFITQLSQEHVHEEPTEIVAAVTVFWDINAFPVPLGCEARKVCLHIKQHLEGRGYSGHFTINAIGLLTRIPADVLRALSSCGIILKNVPFDFTYIINQWISFNSPPASTFVLCPYSKTFPKFLAPIKKQGYNIMVLELNYLDWQLWQHTCPEALETLQEDKCSETDASWVCSVCQDISGKGFENFLTHLYEEHVHAKFMKKIRKKNKTLIIKFRAGGEAPLESLPDTVSEEVKRRSLSKYLKNAWVERLSVLAAPSECHENKEEAVEAGVEADEILEFS